MNIHIQYKSIYDNIITLQLDLDSIICIVTSPYKKYYSSKQTACNVIITHLGEKVGEVTFAKEETTMRGGDDRGWLES